MNFLQAFLTRVIPSGMMVLLLATTPQCVQAAGTEVTVSYYGNGGKDECGKNRSCQGARTACGQAYNMHQISVAHKSLACGTFVRLCHEGRCLITTVTDRGPYIEGRSFDLSLEAARRLGITQQGVATVHVLIIL